jgi:predicted Zn-dependent peptidase
LTTPNEVVTLEQIKVVAAKYLKPETAVIVTVKPGK